jgi:hypothetical protein
MVKELTISTRNKATVRTAEDGSEITVARNHENNGRYDGGLATIGYISYGRLFDALSYDSVVQLRDAFQAILDDLASQKPTVREFLDDLDTGAVVELPDIIGRRTVTIEKRADGTWFVKSKDKHENAVYRDNVGGQFPDVSDMLVGGLIADEVGLKHIGYVREVTFTDLDFIPA